MLTTSIRGYALCVQAIGLHFRLNIQCYAFMREKWCSWYGVSLLPRRIAQNHADCLEFLPKTLAWPLPTPTYCGKSISRYVIDGEHRKDSRCLDAEARLQLRLYREPSGLLIFGFYFFSGAGGDVQSKEPSGYMHLSYQYGCPPFVRIANRCHITMVPRRSSTIN